MALGDIRKALGLRPGQSLHEHRTYRIWRSMNQRCYRKNHHARERYFGRGITVCDSWRNDFLRFLSDMGHPPTPSHSIDRIDNSSGYSPKNCKWSTRKEQNRNRESSVTISTPNGEMSITEAAELFGINVDTLWRRINILKWPESDWFLKNQKRGTRNAHYR